MVGCQRRVLRDIEHAFEFVLGVGLFAFDVHGIGPNAVQRARLDSDMDHQNGSLK